MAAESKMQTVISFPEYNSCMIEAIIPDFSGLKDKSAGISSDTVTMSKSTWCVVVLPYENANNVAYVGAYVQQRLENGSNEKYRVKFKISVMNSKTNRTSPEFSAEGTVTFKACCRGWGSRPFIKHSDIWGPNPTLVLVNDTLRIRAEISCIPLTNDSTSEPALAETLQKKNMAIFNSDAGQDFVLVSSDGTEHSVHKVFLITASSVFRRMFESNLEECKIGRCIISDTSSATLDALLKFMYYGCVTYPVELAEDLMVAANKYELLFLKQHCEKTVIAKIGLGNVADLLFLADRIDAKDLKKAALEYLAANSTAALSSGNIDDILESGDLDLIKDVVAAMLKVDLTA